MTGAEVIGGGATVEVGTTETAAADVETEVDVDVDVDVDVAADVAVDVAVDVAADVEIDVRDVAEGCDIADVGLIDAEGFTGLMSRMPRTMWPGTSRPVRSDQSVATLAEAIHVSRLFPNGCRLAEAASVFALRRAASP